MRKAPSKLPGEKLRLATPEEAYEASPRTGAQRKPCDARRSALPDFADLFGDILELFLAHLGQALQLVHESHDALVETIS